MNIVIANIIALLSNGLNGISSFFKTKKTVLILQTIECLMGSVAQIFASGYAAASQLFICAIRNFVNSTGVKSKWIHWLFSLFFLVFGLLFNNKGFIGYLPVFATIQYTLWTGYCKTAQGVRYGMLINYIPWIIHDFYIHMYTSAFVMSVFEIVVIINIIRYRRKKNETRDNT